MVVRPYGVGVDCHSRCYQVCLRIKDGDTFRLFEYTAPANAVL